MKSLRMQQQAATVITTEQKVQNLLDQHFPNALEVFLKIFC